MVILADLYVEAFGNIKEANMVSSQQQQDCQKDNNNFENSEQQQCIIKIHDTQTLSLTEDTEYKNRPNKQKKTERDRESAKKFISQ